MNGKCCCSQSTGLDWYYSNNLQSGHKIIHWGIPEGMIVAFCCLCCGRTPAALPRSSTAPHHPASSDFVVELYVGVDPCLAAECWLQATSVTSCKGWEASALEKGPERTKVTGTFVQACVKTPDRGREGLCCRSAHLPSGAIRPLCQKLESGLLLGRSRVQRHSRSRCASRSC